MAIKKDYPLLKVNQWLPEWDEITSFDEAHRRRPEPCFYIGSMPAGVLKNLSGVLKRETSNREGGGEDLGIQRRHEVERSAEIQRYRQYGFPWSTLSTRTQDDLFSNLKMPGWLPTAIIANVKTVDDIQSERLVDPDDLCTIDSSGGTLSLRLPKSLDTLPWAPKRSRPIEIIDGQHRLFAFDDDAIEDDYDLPVVIFNGLDLTWQAYLFYVVNIKPKKINPSLAYDLYPLLRDAEWLEKTEGPKVYRETRAQELVQTLWQYPNSAFHNRINMLGEAKSPFVNQASWVRNIASTLLKPGDRQQPRRYGGFFGCLDRELAGWSRIQQTAFVIFAINNFVSQVYSARPSWLSNLGSEDPLFSRTSLFNSDQGIRGYLQVLNDLMIKGWEIHCAHHWSSDVDQAGRTEEQISQAMEELAAIESLTKFVATLNRTLARFSWLTADNPSLHEAERRTRLAYKGSSGYAVLRLDLYKHIADDEPSFSSLVGDLLESL